MINDQTLPSRRHREVVARARQRQARIHQPTNEDILKLEQELFAEDDVYVPQLLQAYTEAHGLPEPAAFVAPPASRLAPKSLEPLPTPAESLLPKEQSEFERQHNALRLYIFQQFLEGKKAKAIAEMIGISAYKITRWYNEVKDQPEIARLWTPLIKEDDLRKWHRQAPQPEAKPEPELKPALALRVQEPSPEAVLAAKAALKQAERKALLQADHREATARLALRPRQTVAQELHQEGWSAARIARAFELETATVTRWLVRPETTARPLPTGPLSQIAQRSVALLKPILEGAEENAEGNLCLRATSAVERERIMAALSVLNICPERPRALGSQFLIPVAPEEVPLLRHFLSLAV